MVRRGERIHLIGIAGSGAAGLALLAHHAGARIDGCDADGPSPYTLPLAAAGVEVITGHDPAHLAGVDRVAITPALRANPDLPELRRRTRCRAAGRALAGAARRADGGRGAHRPCRHRDARQVDHHRAARAPPRRDRDGPHRRGRRLHGRVGRQRSGRERGAVRGRGRRVRRQLPELPPGRGHRHQRGDGSPRLLRRSRCRPRLDGALRARHERRSGAWRPAAAGDGGGSRRAGAPGAPGGLGGPDPALRPRRRARGP